jgi:hypothetical protein
MDDSTPLERLDAISRELEALATEVAVRAKAFGGESGAGPRVSLVKQRLKVALDELAGYPGSADDITDE